MITKERFGYLPDGREVLAYTIENEKGMKARFSAYGGILLNLWVPDKDGVLRDVVLGFDTLEEYLKDDSYFGCSVGRFANYISLGQFPLNGKIYQTTINDRKNSLHGGSGFNTKLWSVTEEGEKLAFFYHSPEGEDGYPGNLDVTIRFWLDEENGFHLCYDAKTDADTILNLTNHSYFNLHGGDKVMLSHELYMNADKYTAVDEEIVPICNMPAEGTDYDFRKARVIEKTIYDNNFCFAGYAAPQVQLYEKETGILMEIFTDCPGIQIYTSQDLTPRRGKNGVEYGFGQGLVMETQLPPNAPNRAECDDMKDRYILRGGESYHTESVYRFSIR